MATGAAGAGPKHMPKIKPPQHPRYLDAQRFFARIRQLDIECPHCGLVYRIRSRTAQATRRDIYDPRIARFACVGEGGCQKVYIIGVLAWPSKGGTGSNTPPYDQTPGPRQLNQMRAEGVAWWMPDESAQRGRPIVTNLTGEEERPEPEDESDLQLADGEEEP